MTTCILFNYLSITVKTEVCDIHIISMTICILFNYLSITVKTEVCDTHLNRCAMFVPIYTPC